MKKKNLKRLNDYVIFELEEPDPIIESYAVKIGLKEDSYIYILPDGYNAKSMQEVTGIWPKRIEQTFIYHWAYQNGVSLE